MNRNSILLRLAIISFLLSVLFGLTLPAQAMMFDPRMVHSDTLPNGLRVIVAEEPEAPVIAVEIVVRVGTADETPETAGAAHLLEHVLWAAGGKDDPRAALEGTGGTTNAGTLRDFTHFYATVPAGSDRMSLTITSLAKVVLRSTLDEEVVRREKQAIVDELASNNDQPHVLLSELAFETLYGSTHPYSHPLESVGSAFHTLEATKLGAFHRRWYVPNNMSVIVVGPVIFATVRTAIENAFGHLPRSPVPSRVIPELPRPLTGKGATLQIPGDDAYVMAAYLGPAINEPTEVCATDTLTVLLSNGSFGRLRKRLLGTIPFVSAVGVDFLTQKERALMGVWVVCKPSDVATVKQAIQEEMTRLITEPPTPIELATAKHLTTTAYAFDNETSSDRARTLAFYEALSHYREAAQYVSRVRVLRVADMVRTAYWYSGTPVWVILTPKEAAP